MCQRRYLWNDLHLSNSLVTTDDVVDTKVIDAKIGHGVGEREGEGILVDEGDEE